MPLVPGIVEVGLMHIRKSKALPKEIHEWIEGAEHGVVYMSFGSNVRFVINISDFSSCLFSAVIKLKRLGRARLGLDIRPCQSPPSPVFYYYDVAAWFFLLCILDRK